VIVGTAWFTIAMLMFRESEIPDRRPIAEPLRQDHNSVSIVFIQISKISILNNPNNVVAMHTNTIELLY